MLILEELDSFAFGSLGHMVEEVVAVVEDLALREAQVALELTVDYPLLNSIRKVQECYSDSKTK
jgi:hypothetical protein